MLRRNENVVLLNVSGLYERETISDSEKLPDYQLPVVN